MAHNGRRGFLQSFSSVFANKKQRSEPIRPPYCKDKDLFISECPRCENIPCVAACKENIIKISSDKTPCLDFSKTGCTFCDECAKVCERGVLSCDDDIEAKIDVNVSIDIVKCISWNGVVCYLCKDVCYDDAIEFLGMLRAKIVSDKCTGCGFCYGVCPTNAIEFKINSSE